MQFVSVSEGARGVSARPIGYFVGRADGNGTKCPA